MKYDLIVIGAGPGGLVAAKTAAEDGLKVLLLERRRNITQLDRACSEAVSMQRTGFRTAKIPPGIGIEPITISAEFSGEKKWFHFPKLGFSLEYKGALRIYHNRIYQSPSGYQIRESKDKDHIWGVGIDKEALVSGLLSSAEKAGVEVRAEVIGLAAENTADGVKVRVQTKSGEETLGAKRVIAADGQASKIVESMGLNETRRIVGPGSQILMYILEGVSNPLSESSFIKTSIPSINRREITLALWAHGMNQLVTGVNVGEKVSLPTILENFMKHSPFASWFQNARIVRKKGCTTVMRTPIGEAAIGSVIIIGDAAAFVETGIRGALACGYQAAKATLKALNGQDGNKEYVDWWQHSFYFHSREYLMAGRHIAPIASVCTDEEVDFVYKLFQDKEGMPGDIIADNLEVIKQERPEIYDKLLIKKEGGLNKKGSK